MDARFVRNSKLVGTDQELDFHSRSVFDVVFVWDSCMGSEELSIA